MKLWTAGTGEGSRSDSTAGPFSRPESESPQARGAPAAADRRRCGNSLGIKEKRRGCLCGLSERAAGRPQNGNAGCHTDASYRDLRAIRRNGGYLGWVAWGSTATDASRAQRLVAAAPAVRHQSRVFFNPSSSNTVGVYPSRFFALVMSACESRTSPARGS
jgi:hypothetical protein